MKIVLTLEVKRRRDRGPEAPDGLEFAPAHLERAEREPVGFRIEPPSDPAYDRRGRRS